MNAYALANSTLFLYRCLVYIFLSTIIYRFFQYTSIHTYFIYISIARMMYIPLIKHICIIYAHTCSRSICTSVNTYIYKIYLDAYMHVNLLTTLYYIKVYHIKRSIYIYPCIHPLMNLESMLFI